MAEVKIITSFICPPIPDRNHDWHAYWSCDDPEDLPVEGYGRAEESAVISLLQNTLYTLDKDEGADDLIIDLALKGWQNAT